MQIDITQAEVNTLIEGLDCLVRNKGINASFTAGMLAVKLSEHSRSIESQKQEKEPKSEEQSSKAEQEA